MQFEQLLIQVYWYLHVLSTLPKPTIALVIPETVPVNVGDANVA
jgi:ABC-type amino acid transport system permease subunit